MRISMNRELENLETHIPFLGTVGSISPYIGLFGTVWGIMHAFIALGGGEAGNVADGCTGYRRSTDRDRNRSVRRNSGGNGVQPSEPAREQTGTELRQLYGRVHRDSASSGVYQHREQQGVNHGQIAWTRSSRAQVRNQYRSVTGRAAGAAADLYGDSAHHHQSVEVDLPDATESQAVSTNDDPPVIIEVSGVGQYSVVVEKDRMDQLPPEQVIAEAQRRLESNPKTVFLIGGAKDVPYDEIIKALNLLHSAGVKSVGLMTQPI